MGWPFILSLFLAIVCGNLQVLIFGIPISGVGQWIRENLADPLYQHNREHEDLEF